MTELHESVLEHLVAEHLGDRAAGVLGLLAIEPALLAPGDGRVSRAAVAMATAICLFADLVDSVPAAAAYVADRRAAGERIVFDHGAIRTILFPDRATGALPAGRLAFDRILLPLGYAAVETYPLPRLRMTGFAYCHQDFPETIPQYFVSELAVAAFDADFAAVAKRVFGESADPLRAEGLALLAELAAQGSTTLAVAIAGLPQILQAFGRQHALPTVADYEALLAHSAEAAWISTEGNAFNHATDRVADVDALAEAQRERGRPIKERVEVSASGRIRQTAFRAAMVTRALRTEEGRNGGTMREVPGSFYEFITRGIDPATGALDLRFDSGNATGIFQMTKANRSSPR